MFVLACTMVWATIIAKSIISYIYAFNGSNHPGTEMKQVHCLNHKINIKQ
jgi:hypothetical protein